MSVNLLLFFAAALCALVLLTRTLVSVSQVQASVHDAVLPSTRGIADDTALLPELTQTNQIATSMLRSGQLVGASLTRVNASTNDIATQLGEVQTGTSHIDASVAGIARSSTEMSQLVSRLQHELATTDRTASGVAAWLAGTDRATRPDPGTLSEAATSLSALLALIPAISQQVGTMSRAVSSVDGHLAAVGGNSVLQLTDLLQLRNLLPVAREAGGR